MVMCKKKELSFSIFILYSLADNWKMSLAKVYKILNSTGILDNYIIKCYDVLWKLRRFMILRRGCYEWYFD